MGRHSRDVAVAEIAKFGGPPEPAPRSLDDMEPILARWPIMLRQEVNGDLRWRYIAEDKMRRPESIDPREGIATYRLVSGNRSRNMVRIDGFVIPAARIAWLLRYGEWPKGRIIWRNENTMDDRIENLDVKLGAPLTGRDRKRPVGVSKRYDRWQAYVRFPNGGQRNLGVFKTEAEAIAARKAWDDGNDLV